MERNLVGVLGLVKYGENNWEMLSERKLQCLALYLQETTDAAVEYNFDEHSAGPTSETVTTLLNNAIERDLLVEKERVTFGGKKAESSYILTEDGAAVVETSETAVPEAAKRIANEHGSIPISNLIVNTVDDFPRFKAAFSLY